MIVDHNYVLYGILSITNTGKIMAFPNAVQFQEMYSNHQIHHTEDIHSTHGMS